MLILTCYILPWLNPTHILAAECGGRKHPTILPGLTLNSWLLTSSWPLMLPDNQYISQVYLLSFPATLLFYTFFLSLDFLDLFPCLHFPQHWKKLEQSAENFCRLLSSYLPNYMNQPIPYSLRSLLLLSSDTVACSSLLKTISFPYLPSTTLHPSVFTSAQSPFLFSLHSQVSEC